MALNQFEIRNQFIEIVDRNGLRDVVIPVAADDPDLRASVLHQVVEPDDDGAYESVIRDIISRYSLRDHQVDAVINLCEQNVTETIGYE